MEEHEILEFLLFYCISRKNTNEIAHMLINKFGSIQGACDATIDELAKIPYIKENGIVFLKAINELIKRQKSAEKIYSFNGCYNSVKNVVRKISLEINVDGIYSIVLGENKKFLFVCEAARNQKGGFDFRNMFIKTNPYDIRSVIIFKYEKNGNMLPTSFELEALKGVEDMLSLRNIFLYEYFLVNEREIMGIIGEEWSGNLNL